MGRSVRFNGSCYTSQLAIILSTEMNGTSLQCQGTDNIIGSDTLSVISGLSCIGTLYILYLILAVVVVGYLHKVDTNS